MAEDLFQNFCVNTRRYAEHSIPIKASVRTENVEMRIEAKEITKGLDGNDSAGDCILLRDNGSEKHFQRGPCTSAQMGKQLSVIKEVFSENFGYAEDEMSMRNGLEDFFAKPLQAVKKKNVRANKSLININKNKKIKEIIV